MDPLALFQIRLKGPRVRFPPCSHIFLLAAVVPENSELSFVDVDIRYNGTILLLSHKWLIM